MNKRKPPILLASLLLLLVGAVGLMNYRPASAGPQDHDHPHTEQGADEGKELGTASQPIPDQKQDMKQSLANAAAKGDSPGQQPQMPDQPTVKIATMERPRPNENAVAGQWYRPNARQVQNR